MSIRHCYKVTQSPVRYPAHPAGRLRCSQREQRISPSSEVETTAPKTLARKTKHDDVASDALDRYSLVEDAVPPFGYRVYSHHDDPQDGVAAP